MMVSKYFCGDILSHLQEIIGIATKKMQGNLRSLFLIKFQQIGSKVELYGKLGTESACLQSVLVLRFVQPGHGLNLST